MDIEISKAAFEEIVGKVSINRFIAKRNKPVGIDMDGIVLWRQSSQSVTMDIAPQGIPFMVEDAGPEYRYED